MKKNKNNAMNAVDFFAFAKDTPLITCGSLFPCASVTSSVPNGCKPLSFGAKRIVNKIIGITIAATPPAKMK